MAQWLQGWAVGDKNCIQILVINALVDLEQVTKSFCTTRQYGNTATVSCGGCHALNSFFLSSPFNEGKGENRNTACF